jgi:hypothetical protein
MPRFEPKNRHHAAACQRSLFVSMEILLLLRADDE